VLDDTEIRRVWKAAEQAGTFGGLIRLLLLTAQRRDKVTSMRRADISDDGVWEIPTAPREKGHAGALRLPPIALDIIKAQPRFASTPFVFAGRGKGPINGFRSKGALTKRLALKAGFYMTFAAPRGRSCRGSV
jgi:integrase